MIGTHRGGDERGGANPWAERWPERADVVGLVAAPDGGTRACEAAVELADASGRDRRTLLANLAGRSPDLDAHLGSTAEEGLFQAGRSGRSLREIALRPPARRFLYLPAGGGTPPGDREGRALRTPVVGLVARVAERVRERGGRLLVFLRVDGGTWPETLRRLLDGLVLLEGADAPAAGSDATPDVLGRWPPEEDGPPPAEDEPPDDDGGPAGAPGVAPDEASAEDEADAERRRSVGPGAPNGDGASVSPEGAAVPDDGGRGVVRGEGQAPGPWRRHRRSSGPPWTRMAVGALVIAALAAGWWWLVREAAERDADGGDAAAVEVAVDSAPDADEAPRPDGTSDAGAAQGTGTSAAAARVAGAPALPYSVLIASYARWPQARQRLEAWREPDGPVYYVAPTRIRGGLYWRLFAGALPDRTSGEALMQELVERGRKDRARAWDVRPVELAFLTGTATSRSAAGARVAALEERGVPAYALPAAGEGDTAWAVYAGGFESEDEASELRALLRDAEIEAELVERRGETDTR